MVARQYRVRGVVQGVGFRPFIHRLAREFGIKGWVLNDTSGVLIEAHGAPESHQQFLRAIGHQAPPAAVVASIETKDILDPQAVEGFSIRESVSDGGGDTLIPPDLSVCPECHAELMTVGDRRFHYPFINCTNCGPRYSIINDMPYDRAKTTMNVFRMCHACEREYHDIESRRYHAQPNACPACGPRLSVHQANGTKIASNDPLGVVIAALHAGKIVAIKSLGGFHFAVDAQNEAAVRQLRRRKRRDAKPFALMVRDIATAMRIASPTRMEISLLQSTERPITLVRKQPGSLPEEIAPRNPNLGLMLPSTPLHYLLVDQGMDVLVMSSANISSYPLEFTNDGALERLRDVADLFLLHDRDIRIRVDDSIVKCTEHPDLPKPLVTFIRRARGYAPYPVNLPDPVAPVLAYGSELKSTVAIGRGSDVFLSQHIGDLGNRPTLDAHEDLVTHLAQLLNVAPTAIACDQHPLFNGTDRAMRNTMLPVYRIQHHHAHMAACMAENGLQDGTAVGIILDGTGYGSDGTIWGGEFLVGGYATFQRRGHLRRFRLLGGDAAVREPFRVAVALLQDSFGDNWQSLDLPFANRLVEGRGALLDRMCKSGVNSPICTSMGRLFDGVAALLGLCPAITYEAQAAIELEALLERDLRLAEPLPFALDIRDGVIEVDHRPLVRSLMVAAGDGMHNADLSRRFHSGVVSILIEVAARLATEAGTKTIVLSGGVFMNEFILANAIAGLRARGLDPHWHSKVPPNDGGLSLGQVMVADALLRIEANQSAKAAVPEVRIREIDPANA